MEDLSRPFQAHPDAVQKEKELDKLGNEIAELSAQIQAATYRYLVLLGEFDKRGGWNNGAARSCAHWLSWRCGIDLGAARQQVRVARALEKLPLISEAFRKGEVSYSKVRAMTRVASGENERKLMIIAKGGTAAHVEKVVRAWRRLDAAEERKLAQRQEWRRELQMYTDEDGTVVLRARLTPEVGAVVRRALEAAKDALYERDHPSPSELSYETRLADALGLVAESALNSGGAGAAGPVGSRRRAGRFRGNVSSHRL